MQNAYIESFNSRFRDDCRLVAALHYRGTEDPSLALVGLLHDAHEALIGDSQWRMQVGTHQGHVLVNGVAIK